MSSSHNHPRTALNNACQQLFGNSTPEILKYESQSRGPNNDVVWTTIIYIKGIEYGRGEGKTRGAASDTAATQALSQLRIQYRF